MRYESKVTVESQTTPGVKFTVRRMSFGRRLELMRIVRELAARAEFRQAGNDPKDRIEAALLGGEIERLYLEWGVAAVDGIEVDGDTSLRTVFESGPEELTREMVAAVRRECGLNEEERKN